ncbi:hypothetical protein [Desulfovibrio sp. TomC]|uniref:hypothetical protein n=1 Tax=Desulfovibrio sp. TomC TaxID=1562888 RepID=UPI000573877E|nr:hypothetical protein [Desulfovibrio sp. TomC]KHK02775.1 hypothetical protein NY78_1725 [Desulfovibrio sp. TomC]
MPKKEHVKKVNAVICAYFAHTGYLTREEAKELCGLEDSGFEEAYKKAGNIFAKVGSEPDKGVSKLFTHLSHEVDEYMKHISGYGIA